MKNVATHVIAKCGGHKVVSEWLGISLISVYRWTYPKDRGGTGGVVPQDRQEPLILAARSQGINLGPADFFHLSTGGEAA